jgi:TetR/AcrR family transcriptional regulator
VTEIRQKLPAAERRRAVLEAATRAFAEGSYRGTTTAEIARAVGCSEPILYRHFPSKRDLYLACMEHQWQELKAQFEEAVEAGDPKAAVHKVKAKLTSVAQGRAPLSQFWVQALTEANEDPVIRRWLRRHLQEVHDFLADEMRLGQQLGVVLAERDVEAEAWITMGGILLGAVGQRLGGLLDDVLPRIVESRRQWMTGSTSP